MQFTDPGLHHMRLAKTARTFSIVALFTALFQTIFLPYIFGGLAIIFAAISKGNNAHYQLNAKIAILLSIFSLSNFESNSFNQSKRAVPYPAFRGEHCTPNSVFGYFFRNSIASVRSFFSLIPEQTIVFKNINPPNYF